MEKAHFAILTIPYYYAHVVCHWTVWTNGKLSVVDRIVASRDVHVLSQEPVNMQPYAVSGMLQVWLS